MIFVILSTLLTFFVTYSLGTALLNKVISGSGRQANSLHPEIISLTGLLPVLFIAFVFAWLNKLDWTSRVTLVVLAILSAFIHRKTAFDLKFNFRRIHLIQCVYVLFFFLICSANASLESKWADDYGYYAHAIRWLEEAGLVKGMANTNPRIGFPTTWFLFSAIFNFSLPSFISYDLVNYVILCAAIFSSRSIPNIANGQFNASNLMQIGMMPCIFLFWFLVGSPSSDIAATYIVIIISILFLSIPEKRIEPNTLILLICLVITIKLTAFAYILLIPGLVWIYSSEIRKRYIALSIGASLVWFSMSFISTGYLIYPFIPWPGVAPYWTIPLQTTLSDLHMINTSIYNYNDFSLSGFARYIGDLYQKIDLNNKILFACAGFLPIYFIWRLLKSLKGGLDKMNLLRLLYLSALFAGLLVWLKISVRPRLGYLYLLPLFFLLYADIMTYVSKRTLLGANLLLIAFFFYTIPNINTTMIHPGKNLVEDFYENKDIYFGLRGLKEHILFPSDYNITSQLGTTNISGTTYYIAGDGISCTTEFPCTCKSNIELRDGGHKQGILEIVTAD